MSPDGSKIAFEWAGDLWLVSSSGGEARPLTINSARDSYPRFSPDGQTIAFLSDREGTPQIFTISAASGTPKQITFHTAGFDQLDWTPDGKTLLARGTRDFFWRHGERLLAIAPVPHSPETLVFDDYESDAQVSPDGKKILFTREGGPWWRKGNRGASATQVWLYDIPSKTFEKILHKDRSCRWPMWRPDAFGFYYVEDHADGSNLFEYDFHSKTTKQLTKFETDSIVFPSIARDGSRIVFRHLFDLYTYVPAAKSVHKLDIVHNADRQARTADTRVLSTASEVAFTSDGLEMAFIAGGDLWVMDTELREPIPVTRTPQDERQPLFTADGQALYFVGSKGDTFTISKATRVDAKKFWWQNGSFKIETLGEFAEPPRRLKLSPDGKKLVHVRGGTLWITDLDLKNPVKTIAGWSDLDYDWSPDGQWIVYASNDNDFNQDVWIIPSAGGKAVNISRHPFNESDPVWSPDGTMIAFTGQRASTDSGANIALVYLRAEDDAKNLRDRKIEKALEKMKGRTPKKDEKDDKKETTKEPAKETKADAKKVTIDFDGLVERVRRIPLGDGAATQLVWSPDSKKLVFTGSFEGKSGAYAIDIGDTLTPKPFLSTVGNNPVWLKQGNQIVWLVGGVPTSTPATAVAPAPTPVGPTPTPKGIGAVKSAAPSGPGAYTFAARQDLDIPGRNAAVFDECWRVMRDQWYDAKLNNRDWNAVRAKYRPMAREAPDMETVATVVQLMLGELNGSHLGFTFIPTDAGEKKPPREITPHLGVRFDHAYPGPGLKIRDVIPGGPADKPRSRLAAGEIIKSVNGKPVDLTKDLPGILNGPIDRDLVLVVDNGGKTREVILRPTTYPAVQALLYDQWLDRNRKAVESASQGTLGYLHISQMSMPTFRKFEEELVSQGVGKDGLVIDVRENPGGSTADHLLTALTQPVHAITVPRGGGPGYPHDRKIYETWHKPIVILCNQNSGSNAEIFSHAIKTLKRGQLVGVPTAGAVISTGATPIMDVGLLRLPFRGWFVIGDGLDMEKNGAVPHHELWLEPTTLPAGRDAQLSKAIEVLMADVAAWQKRPQAKLKYSTE